VFGGALIWELERSPWFGEAPPERLHAGAPPRGAPHEVAVLLSPER
jgi:hypothetical protein